MCTIPDLVYSHWPSPELFYAERDHRTLLQVRDLRTYVHTPVSIHVQRKLAADLTVQRIAIMTANLTARWARNVQVVVPEIELIPPLGVHGDGNLGARIRREMREADPFGNFEIVDQPEGTFGTLRLFIGGGEIPDLVEADYVVDGSGWNVVGHRGWSQVEYSRVPAAAPTAALAAAIGAADLFKRAIGQPSEHWIRGVNWCTWNHSFGLPPGAGNTTPTVSDVADVGNLLVAGIGAIGSALLYILGLMISSGRVTILDRDRVETSNLNRSPLFTAYDAACSLRKIDSGHKFLSTIGLDSQTIDGNWSEHGERLGRECFDAWISLTNEQGAWAEVPYQLPPVVLHGTTTSGWGAGVGRHIPRIEDCTACRLPRPKAEFRGPCAEGDIQRPETPSVVRASLPFLSSISAALVATELLKLALPGCGLLPNSVSVDFKTGLPAVVAVRRGPTAGCDGCRIAHYPIWALRGGRGRYAGLSLC